MCIDEVSSVYTFQDHELGGSKAHRDLSQKLSIKDCFECGVTVERDCGRLIIRLGCKVVTWCAHSLKISIHIMLVGVIFIMLLCK
jgi:hypothetical protein